VLQPMTMSLFKVKSTLKFFCFCRVFQRWRLQSLALSWFVFWECWQ